MNKWSQVIALEQNSSYTRVMVVTRDGRVRGAAYERHNTISPQPGWVELDPAELWYKAKKVLAAGLDIHRSFPEEIAAVGVTGEASSVIVWDRETGEPYYNALLQSDTRTRDLVDQFRTDGAEEMVRTKTGLLLSTRFSAPKLAWLLEKVPGLRANADSGRALFGGMDAWLLWQLTGEHATDYASAAFTLLFNIRTLDWDQQLLDLFRIPRSILPNLHPSSDSRLFGSTKERTPFNGSVPVAADLCAPQAACFGLATFGRGEVSLVQTPADTVFLNTGGEIISASGEVCSTLAYSLQPAESCYGLQMDVNDQLLVEVMRSLAGQSGIEPVTLKVDGDRGLNNAWMQQQADALGIPVLRPRVVETASLGAAYAAGLAVGFWKDLDELRGLWKAARVFEPGSGQWPVASGQ